MIWLSFYPAPAHSSFPDQFMFVMGDDVETAQPYRMIGSPLRFTSLRDAVDAASFCGFKVLEDGHVISQAA